VTAHETELDPAGFRPVGPNRIRENVGLLLEDFVPGTVIEHRPARTITETEHVLALALTGNVAPVHSDIEFCESIGLSDVVVCGVVTLGIVLGASVRTTSGMTTASLGVSDLTLSHPVTVGDTIYSESEILNARRSESRPGIGIVECRVRGLNQRGDEVICFTRTFMVPTRDSGIRERTGY
jgi:itaconyl-CoA hydratase